MLGAKDQTDFKLLRYFTTTSLVAFVVVAGLLGYVFRTLSINAMLGEYEGQHTNMARFLANEIWEHQFDTFILDTEAKTANEIKQMPQIPLINREMVLLLKGTSIFKVKLYNRQGMTVFSSDPKQIGIDKSSNPGVIGALRGRSASELTHRNSFSTFEGEVQNRDLVESYVPLYDPFSGKLIGVFEIYGDATQSVAYIGERQLFIVTTVVGLLALLYMVLFIIVQRAQNLINRQNLERERSQQALSESEERWKFALEGAGDGVWDRNMQTGEVVYSKRYREMYGFSDEDVDLLKEDWDSRVHPDDLKNVLAERQAYLTGQTRSYANERRMQCKDGSWKWVLSRGMVVARDAQGNPARMIGTHSDISERHKREEELRLAATVFDTVDEAVVITDMENRIVSVNPAFTTITGYQPGEVIGKDPKLLGSGMHSAEFYRDMWQQLTSTGAWHGEISNRHKNGKLYVEWLSIKKVSNRLGVSTHYVAVFSDITERKAAEERMQHLAHFDLLTGLANRTLFTDRLQQAVAKARRDKNNLALMFIDLDEFKPVNDGLGHHIGDLLLKEVANRLQECLRRESDTVGRLGGDEFVVILPEIEAAKDALNVADKILHTLNQPFDIAGHDIHISASIGIALFPEHGSDEKLLLKSADAAMYRAKEGGRNRLVLAE
ncbi:MAG: diguanylate cyclase [Betaproteobacteria bacterium]|nr:diguanylate cyclase [Betaproteobacteria bacterium]